MGTFHQDNFLGSFAGSGDIQAQIDLLNDKSFFKDGSKSMEGAISMSANTIIGAETVQVNELAVGILPPSGQVGIYAKTDKSLYIQDDTGLETEIGAGGDVDGPASATNNGIAVYSGTTGKIIKESGNGIAVTIDDITGDLVIPGGRGIIFTESKSPTTESVEMTAGSMASSYTIILPTVAPNAGEVLANTTGFSNTAWEQRCEFDPSNGVPIAIHLIPIFEDTTGNIIEAQQFIGIDIATGNFTRLAFPWITVTGDSTGWGTDSMISITTSTENLAVGDNAAELLSTGIGQNTILGIEAAKNGAAFSNIVAIGHSAGQAITSTECVFIGTGSGLQTAAGRNCVFIGYISGQDNITGDDSVGVGHRSLENLTGSNCIGIGKSAGDALVASDDCIMIGSPGVVGDSGDIRIGNSTDHTGSCFIQAIKDKTPAGGGLETVTIDDNGEMGSQTALQNSTGVIAGGILSINADDTKFDISDGNGCVYNPVTQATTVVSWTGLTAQSVAYAGTFTFISIDSAGAISSATAAPTNAETRDDIFLGNLVHPNATNIVAVANEQIFLLNPINQLRDISSSLGNINSSGNVCSSNSLLTYAKTAGTMGKFGANYENDLKDPNILVLDATDTNVADVFSYLYQDGSQSATNLTDVIMDEYDDGNGQGSPGSVGNNQWTTQRIFAFTSQAQVLMPGQFLYNNAATAIANVETEAFVFAPSITTNSILVAYLITRGGGNDLTDTGDGIFIKATILGGLGSTISGNVSQADSSVTVNALARYESTTGQVIENSLVTVDDSGTIAGIVTLDINHTATEDDDHAAEIIMNAAGFGDAKAINVGYTTGALAVGEDAEAMLVNVDQTAATGGRVVGLEVIGTTGSAEIDAVEVGVGVHPIRQQSGTFGDADVLLNIAANVTVALSGGGGGGISTFVADNNTFTVQDAAKFSEMEWILDTGSSGRGIQPLFEFSDGSGPTTWDAFNPSDGTNQMRQSGVVLWNIADIPSWVVGDSGNFEIRITRQRNTLATTPITDLVQISATAIFTWDDSGDLVVNDIQAATLTAPAVTSTTTLTATGDVDFNITTSFDVLTTDNTATANRVRAQGGTSAEIHIENLTGTTDDSIKIDSVAGGIDMDSVGDFHLDVANGRIDLHSVGSTSGMAIQLNSLAGGVDIDAALNILLQAATGRIDLAAVASTAINAVMLDAQAGGVDISAALDVDIDAASDIFMDAATGRIDLRAVASTSATAIQLQGSVGGVNISSGLNAAQCIHIHANAGTAETIRIHSDQGTGGASIDLESDLGGIQIIAEASTLTDAIKIDAQAGGVDIDATLNVDIRGEDDVFITAADGRVDLRAITSTSATAIQLDAAQGGVGITSDNLAAASAIQIKALGTDSGIELDAMAGGISINQSAGASKKLGFFGATPLIQTTTGVAENSFTENAGGAVVNVDSTFGGYTLQQVVNALQLIGILA